MAQCCEIILTPFVNESTTTVPYSGDKPTVTVSYLVDGVWNLFVATVVQLLTGSVVVDHSGPSTGIIKIVK